MGVYGYGRVSSQDQNEQRQIDAFLAKGIKELFAIILLQRKSLLLFQHTGLTE